MTWIIGPALQNFTWTAAKGNAKPPG